MRVFAVILTILAGLSPVLGDQTDMTIPEDFPRFSVPGHENEMRTLRDMFWLHYPSAEPLPTMWDEWLPNPALWPAVSTDGYSERMRREWREALSGRFIDPEGYVSSHQHASIAHQHGWPLPFWNQGVGGWGWHFSFKDTVPMPWRPDTLSTQEGWQIQGAEDQGIDEYGWNLDLTETRAAVVTPEREIDTFQAPFIQLRWRANGLANAQPYIEWTTRHQPEFGPDRRFYFEPVDSPKMVYTMVPMHRHPKWSGYINRLRICFGNRSEGGSVTIQALFTQYDTRQNINNTSFIQGCSTYFRWTRDIDFLRENINRMRTALRYMMTEFDTLERKVVFTQWVGHEGRTGVVRKPDGSKFMMSGRGIAGNYWDLLPFGWMDCYATIRYYDALLRLAELEREIAAHPEWNIPDGALKLDPEELLRHAAEVKAEGNRLFWSDKTGRFTAGIDADGKSWDYGFTSLNCDAIYYDFATPKRAQQIMQWIAGERIVDGDTAQGSDIYFWRFAPRSTTKRNLDFYLWGYFNPEDIPWGAQVQDGGAVLGWAYHDLMARLKVRGADDAWNRLQETIRWFDEVQAAGGYRAYYDGSREGTLQGANIPGGLGLDLEFRESVLVTQVILDGFLGFSPTADGFRLAPTLPSGWPELMVDRIRFHDLALRIKATGSAIEILKEGRSARPCFLHLPEGKWRLSYIDAEGKAGVMEDLIRRDSDGAIRLDWGRFSGVRLEDSR